MRTVRVRDTEYHPENAAFDDVDHDGVTRRTVGHSAATDQVVPSVLPVLTEGEQIQCALLNHSGLSEHIENGDAFVGRLNSVFDDRCQIANERLKAVDRRPVGGLFGQGLELGGGGALGGSDDGSAGGLCLRLVIVVEKDGAARMNANEGILARINELKTAIAVGVVDCEIRKALYPGAGAAEPA